MSADISYSRYLVKRFITQLVDGCEDGNCQNRACHTGRCNTSNGRPIRRYTPRSGRAMALVLAAEPNAESLLCQHESLAFSWKEGKRDPTDLAQLLADTDFFQDFLNGNHRGEQLAIDPKIQELHRKLDRYILRDNSNQDEDAAPASDAVTVFSECLAFLLDRLPVIPPGALDGAVLAQNFGSTMPLGPDHAEAIQQFLDALSHEPSQRLCSRLLMAMGRQGGSATAEPHVSRILTQLLYTSNGWLYRGEANVSSVRVHYAWAVMQYAFLAHWDGEPVFQCATVEHTALLFLQRLIPKFIAQIARYEWMVVLPRGSRPDSISLAESWLKYKASPRRHWLSHLLDLGCSLTQDERNRTFRTICHLRQREAHSAAEMAAALRRREQYSNSHEAPPGRLRHNELHYFVLNVRRENVLKDTFDQLWQRRLSELVLPLRVRLGEVEALEVGHDLGGVQIEFFNLICKEAFAAESHLFVTDPESGYHYFRPMSLEPRWKFELLGILMALAVHNGITLPVNFPLIFYRTLLTGDMINLLSRKETVPFRPSWEWIKDGWPVLYKSIKQSLDIDIDFEDAFPLEANGLRMTARAEEERKITGKRILMVYQPTHLETGAQLDPDADIAHEWPGWYVERMTDVPDEVDPADKREHMSDYVKWIVEDSVWPQLLAFHRGFFRLIHLDDLRVISPPAMPDVVPPNAASALKSYIEGTPNVDLDELIETTVYENYDHADPYIQSFWRMLNGWPQEKLRRLVKFVTAAERLPLDMSTFKFVIKKTGSAEPNLLPTSSTCFSTLSLPQYKTAEELDEKLSVALEFGFEGFGTG